MTTFKALATIRRAVRLLHPSFSATFTTVALVE